MVSKSNNKLTTNIIFNVMKTITLTALIMISINAFSQEMGTFTDPRDGKVYKTVKIGDREWFAENLAYKIEGESWAYNNSKKNVKKYGYLYNFKGAQEGCPTGWHLATVDDWKSLERIIGINEVQQAKWESRKNKPAISFRLRSTEGWPKGLNGTNEMGFNMLPSGESGAECCFDSMGEHAYFWVDYPQGQWIFYDDGTIAAYDTASQYSGRSVRCVKNPE